MDRVADQRSGRERRAGTPLNAKPPYLTKHGPVLFDRRNGGDRRSGRDRRDNPRRPDEPA
jgi:hypothetical protein